MTSKFSRLLFPGAIRSLRQSRGMMQKALAIDLGVDPTVLCSAESGARPPLEEELLKRATELLKLSQNETEQLTWTAHHDRLIGHLANKGASDMELDLISACLRASRDLSLRQASGLLASLRELSRSASVVAALGNSGQLMEAAMT